MSERLFNEKIKLIENLTGVDSSKLNYYLEVKKRNEEIIKQNYRLEIIYQIIQDINIDMSLEDIMDRVHDRLPQAVHCDFWGLAMLKKNNLYMTAIVPGHVCVGEPLSESSLLWEAVKQKKSKVYKLNGGEGEVEIYPAIKHLNVRSVVVTPMVVKGNVIGVLAMGSKDENVYGNSEVKFVCQLAGQLAIVIENARLYEQVWRGKKEWEETFRAVTDPIFLIDLNCNVLRYNNRLNKMPGVKNGIEGSSKCYRLIWNRKMKCNPCLLDTVCVSREPAYNRIKLSTGKVYDVFYYPVFNEESEIYGVIHQIKDVTEQIKMEAQLMQSGKLAAIGEMAAGVAHELNSPMTAILGNAQMLLRDLEKEDSRGDYVKDIVNCGLRCKKIIQNLLTYSRQDERPMSSINFNEVVERVLCLVKYQINRNNVQINTELYNRLPVVQANGQQIDQVLINLLINARDALENKKGEKNIKIRTGVNEWKGTKSVYVTVTDNGEGISPETMEKIFNPFFTTKEASKGTGLGLSVSLGIAQAHGGTISVSSKPEKGSSFSLILPVEE